jgi:predicted nucleic acid-binding protein
MRRQVVLDTGPLVAFLNRRDRHHGWATGQLAEVEAPLLTCEAVLSEACFLLRDARGGSRAVLDLLEREVVTVAFSLAKEASAVGRLLGRYENVPMSLADACLVRMAEQDARRSILTLDKGFRIYRKHARHVVPSLLPESR